MKVIGLNLTWQRYSCYLLIPTRIQIEEVRRSRGRAECRFQDSEVVSLNLSWQGYHRSFHIPPLSRNTGNTH